MPHQERADDRDCTAGIGRSGQVVLSTAWQCTALRAYLVHPTTACGMPTSAFGFRDTCAQVATLTRSYYPADHAASDGGDVAAAAAGGAAIDAAAVGATAAVAAAAAAAAAAIILDTWAQETRC